MSDAPAADPASAPDDFDLAVAERKKSWPKKESARAEHPTSPKAADTSVVSEPAPASETPAPETDTTASAAPVEAPSDLPLVPDAVRSKLPTLHADVKAYLKEASAYETRYKDLQAEFTKVTQELAERKPVAALWEQVKKSPAAAKAAMDILESERNGGGAEPEDDGWDFSEHTPVENKAYLRKMTKDVVHAETPGVVVQELQRARAPEERILEVGSILNRYAVDNKIPEDRMLKAIAVAKIQARDLELDWTPKNAVRLVQLGFGLLPTSEQANTRTASNAAPGLARVASPSTRGVGTTAPSIPAWKRDGKKWPTTNAEREEMFLTRDIGMVGPES